MSVPLPPPDSTGRHYRPEPQSEPGETGMTPGTFHGAPYAPWPKRILSAGIDAIIVVALFFIFDGESSFFIPMLYVAAVFVLLQGFTGLTVGKFVLGLRTTYAITVPDGNLYLVAPGVIRCIGRSIAKWVLDVGLTFGLGFLLPLVTHHKQTIGDTLSKTVVVEWQSGVEMKPEAFYPHSSRVAP